MISNKKGVMVKFLVGILITILVLAPTIAFLSKIIGPSQAEKNFNSFVEEIRKFAKDEDQTKTAFVTVLNVGNFIAFFKNKQDVYVHLGNKEIEGSNHDLYFYYPSDCSGNTCLCLCQEYKTRKINNGYEADCQKLSCKQLDFQLEKSWSTVRGKQHPRRTSISLTKQNSKIVVSGGNTYDKDSEDIGEDALI